MFSQDLAPKELNENIKKRKNYSKLRIIIHMMKPQHSKL